MKILKFQKMPKGRYKLLLDNNESIVLYEDVIINNNLLLTKEINKDEIDRIIDQNNKAYAYSLAINYISIKMRSIKEMKEYLIKKSFSNIIIQDVVERLKKEGYLNDVNFSKAFVNDQINLTTSGPYKIKKALLKYGVDDNIVNEAIDNIDSSLIEEKLSKLFIKQIKLKKGSLNAIKIKLINYFINLGYDRDMILRELEKQDLSSNYEILKKEYEKLYKKYKNKYEDSKLLYFISQKLYAKGYTSEDIKKVLQGGYYE